MAGLRRGRFPMKPKHAKTQRSVQRNAGPSRLGFASSRLRVSWAIATAALLLAANAGIATETITARQIVERIQKQSGVQWRTATVDTFKAGDPDTPVKAIACVMMSTLDVLQRAAAGGANFIITHEPTYYGGQDITAPMENENDPVLAAKQEFIKSHGLVIWRFHDHLHAMKPDPVLTGVVNILGWKKYQADAAIPRFVIPATTVEDLAADIRKKFGVRTLRVVGDPKLKVTKVGFSPGASGFVAHRRQFQSNEVEALLIGEGTEWEGIEYAADATTQGKPKALILLGHIASEEAGMMECAKWLKTFVPEVPITFVNTPEFFWMPATK
jgi:putative NIF3 family GTP cyclohydrolase 1 type 2